MGLLFSPPQGNVLRKLGRIRRMREQFTTASRIAVRMGFYALSLLAIVVAGGCYEPALAQNVEGRPVARLIAELPVPNSREKRTKSAKATFNTALVKSPSLDEANAIERRVFDQTNVERKKQGLPPLIWDAALCRMARIHSADMARVGSFTHLSPDGSRLRERAEEVGIVHYTVLGENIAYNLGYDDPGGFAVERWMLSPKHRANILFDEFRSMAVGTFVAADGSVFLTQTFITR